MNGFTDVYKKALQVAAEEIRKLNNPAEQKQMEDDQKELQEHFEVMFLNWKISPVTKDLQGKIENRILELNNANLSLAISTAANKLEQINRNLVEVYTLRKVLSYFENKELELS